MASLLSYALCSVADVKELLGIDSGDSSKNNLIIRKINQATLIIENYTGRHFKSTTYTDEEYDATGTDQLILKQRPVTSIGSIGSRDSSLNESDWSDVEAEDYFNNSLAGVVNLTYNTYGTWNRYKVTYTAGYTNFEEQIPDVVEACATLAAFLVDGNTVTSGSNVKRKTEGQRSIEYFDSQQNAKSLVEQLGLDEMLAPYVNYTLGGR